MAFLHRAQLNPSKIELLSAWVPSQTWVRDVDTSVLEAVGSFRFDDPEGEVGVETHLLRGADGQILQVPLTYRARSLAGAEASFIRTIQHSALGERWVYDATGDPVYAWTLAATILRGGEQAEQQVMGEAGLETLPVTTLVHGSGSSNEIVPVIDAVAVTHDERDTVIAAGGLELRLRRHVERGPDDDEHDQEVLVGRWPEHDAWALLATVRRATNE